MPTGTTLRWDILHGELPSFGPRYEEVTRPGDTTQRWLHQGSRGARVQIQARRYFVRESDALAFGVNCRNLQGYEVRLEDTLNERWIYCFLHAVTFQPLKRIESTTGDNWVVIGTLDIQRTA